MKTIILAESKNYIVAKDYEHVFLKSKSTGDVIFSDTQYGEANKSIISENEDWCVVGGEGILFWSKKNGVSNYLHSPPFFVHDMMQVDKNTIKILIDPWSEYASVWTLDTEKNILAKEKDGPNMQGEPYTEKIIF